MNGARFPTLFVIGIGVAVTVGWLFSLGVEIYTNAIGSTVAYSTPLAVHGLMGTVVGAVYASWRVSKRNGDSDGRG